MAEQIVTDRSINDLAPKKVDGAKTTERALRSPYDVDAPVTAPRARVLENLTLDIPEVTADPKAVSMQLEKARGATAFHASTEAFLLGLNSYLGLPAGSHNKEHFIRDVLATHGQDAAAQGSDVAGNMLHLQLLRLVDTYRQAEEGILDESQLSDVKDRLDRLQEIANLYKTTPKGFDELVRQGRYPEYDEHFLSIMDQAVDAFSNWEEIRPKQERSAVAPAKVEPWRQEKRQNFIQRTRARMRHAKEERFIRRYFSDNTPHSAALQTAVNVINQHLYDLNAVFKRDDWEPNEWRSETPLRFRLAILPEKMNEEKVNEILKDTAKLSYKESFWLKRLMTNYPKVTELAKGYREQTIDHTTKKPQATEA